MQQIGAPHDTTWPETHTHTQDNIQNHHGDTHRQRHTALAGLHVPSRTLHWQRTSAPPSITVHLHTTQEMPRPSAQSTGCTKQTCNMFTAANKDCELALLCEPNKQLCILTAMPQTQLTSAPQSGNGRPALPACWLLLLNTDTPPHKCCNLL